MNDIDTYCRWKSQMEIWEVDDTSAYVEWIPAEKAKWFKRVVRSGLTRVTN